MAEKLFFQCLLQRRCVRGWGHRGAAPQRCQESFSPPSPNTQRFLFYLFFFFQTALKRITSTPQTNFSPPPRSPFEESHNASDLSRLILEGEKTGGKKYANYKLRPPKTKKALRELLRSADAARLPYLRVSAEVESHVTRDYFPSAA